MAYVDKPVDCGLEYVDGMYNEIAFSLHFYSELNYKLNVFRYLSNLYRNGVRHFFSELGD